MGGPNKIKSAMQYGVEKPNLFVVNLFGPMIDGLEQSFGIEGIRCVTAEIPATTPLRLMYRTRHLSCLQNPQTA